jgi:hypothetical protein
MKMRFFGMMILRGGNGAGVSPATIFSLSGFKRKGPISWAYLVDETTD